MTSEDVGLSGRGLQQSTSQWTERGRVLADALSELALAYKPAGIENGLDVGCQDGTLTDALGARVGGEWVGIDPGIAESAVSPAGRSLRHGWADQLPFASSTFDVLVFANVFEHVDPDRRAASLTEMYRVLAPGGIVVGQLPNPYFFVESHSRLPLMGYLPVRLQKRYWRLAPVPWEHDFHVVTIKDLRREATASGFTVEMSRSFNYPIDVIPRSVQWAARAVAPMTRAIPWAWQFVLRRPPGSRP